MYLSTSAKLQLFIILCRLFLEKIRNHPDLAGVSAADRENNKKKLKEILPLAEKIKTQLLARFTQEHEQYKVYSFRKSLDKCLYIINL
jgi:hypothetical protein